MPLPGFITVLGAILLLWGLVTLVRRISEDEETKARTRGRAVPRPPRPRDPRTGRPIDDDIDWEELRRAEDEVRDLGADTKPEDGWEGDDWGPGAPRKPPLV